MIPLADMVHEASRCSDTAVTYPAGVLRFAWLWLSFTSKTTKGIIESAETKSSITERCVGQQRNMRGGTRKCRCGRDKSGSVTLIDCLYWCGCYLCSTPVSS